MHLLTGNTRFRLLPGKYIVQVLHLFLGIFMERKKMKEKVGKCRRVIKTTSGFSYNILQRRQGDYTISSGYFLHVVNSKVNSSHNIPIVFRWTHWKLSYEKKNGLIFP